MLRDMQCDESVEITVSYAERHAVWWVWRDHSELCRETCILESLERSQWAMQRDMHFFESGEITVSYAERSHAVWWVWSRVAAKQHLDEFILNSAKFLENKIIDFREIISRNFANILNYFGKIMEDLFLCVLFKVNLCNKKIYRYFYLKVSGRSYEWWGVRSEWGGMKC